MWKNVINVNLIYFYNYLLISSLLVIADFFL
nr:MAG TPA: hypothetical protein [Caudoviricetes sp.]